MFLQTKCEKKSAAVKQYQESLSPDKKHRFSAAHQKQQQFLSPEDETEMLLNDAAAHKKQRESLPPEKKVKI